MNQYNNQNQTPTNFWDFRHKKIYTNRKEELIDFFSGLIFGPFLFIFLGFIGMFSTPFIVYIYLKLFKQIPEWGSPTELVAIVYLLLLIYTAFKRKHIFYGMLAGIIIIIGLNVLSLL